MSSPASPDQIDIVFRSLLKRSPESAATIQAFQKMDNIEKVIEAVASSAEAQARNQHSPLWHYNTKLDAYAIIRSHDAADKKVVPGRLVNFVGVAIDPAVYPPLLAGREGSIEDAPIPANWHADMAEFAAALRAVDLASETFRVLELGCGWGCWLLITGVAARNRGMKVDLIGAEADEGHVRFAEDSCRENGFSADEFRIHRGIVGPREGTALFPRQETAGASWGLEPKFDASESEIEVARNSGKYDILPIVTLSSIANEKQIDLVHIDIQGGEVSFIESCLSDLQKFVRYVVIGTHSREIEGKLMVLFDQMGWELEMERPAIFMIEGQNRTTAIDGVQGWRNKAIA